MLKVVRVLLLQSIAAYLAHIVFMNKLLNGQPLLGVAMVTVVVFFLFRFPEKVIYKLLICGDPDMTS